MCCSHRAAVRQTGRTSPSFPYCDRGFALKPRLPPFLKHFAGFRLRKLFCLKSDLFIMPVERGVVNKNLVLATTN